VPEALCIERQTGCDVVIYTVSRIAATVCVARERDSMEVTDISDSTVQLEGSGSTYNPDIICLISLLLLLPAGMSWSRDADAGT
jgi:hypothetical protein